MQEGGVMMTFTVSSMTKIGKERIACWSIGFNPSWAVKLDDTKIQMVMYSNLTTAVDFVVIRTNLDLDNYWLWLDGATTEEVVYKPHILHVCF